MWVAVLLLSLCVTGEGYRTALPGRSLQRMRTARHRLQLLVPSKTVGTKTFQNKEIDLDIALDRALGESR